MRLLTEGRRILAQFVPRAWPTFAQWKHAPLFLSQREKNIIAGASVIALIAFGGVLWQSRQLLTVAVPARGGDLTEALVGEPRFINPMFAATDSDRTLTSLVFLPLCDTEERGTPALASSCVRDAQGRYIITLEERSWQDGEPITSNDVVFTFNLMQNESAGSVWRSLAQQVTVGADGARRIIITPHSATQYLPLLLSRGILPAHRWRNVPIAQLRTHDLNRRPVGSGPFAITTVVTDTNGSIRRLMLNAFDDFRPQRAYLNSLTLLVATDEAEAADFFRTRQVDAFVMNDPTRAQEAIKRDVKKYEIRPSVVVSLFLNPQGSALLKQKSVRQAFARAIDRAALISEALHGVGVPTRTPFPTRILPSSGLTAQPAQDISAAKTALAAMNSSSLIIAIPPAPAFTALAGIIQKQLLAVGINTERQVVDPATDPDSLLKAPLILLGQDYSLRAVSPHWHSQSSGVGGTNFARYQIKEVDAWLELLAKESRSAERNVLLKKISDRLATDVPAIFLYQPTYEYYVAATFQGIQMNEITDPTERFMQIQNWYVKTQRAW